MKSLMATLSILIASNFVISQTPFENPSFETWEDVGNPDEEPTEYSSLKTSDVLASFAPQVLWRSGTAHSGSYSVQLIVAPFNSLAGVSPNAIMTNGQVHADFDPENGYVFTNTSDSKWNTPLTERPDSLVGWFQYTPQGGDKGKVEVLLHDDTETGKLPHDGTTSHWVGKARYDITTTTSTWTRFSVPFNYYNNSFPDYVLFVATAGDSTIAVTDSELLLDDIELIYNPLTVSIDPPAQQNNDACANGTTLTVTEGTNAGVVTTPTREWKWSTTSGGPYNSFSTAETGTSYTPNFSTVDTYYIVCETDYGAQGVVTSNEVEIVVTASGGNIVSITPIADQNINANQNGNDLTAIECPTPTGREWLYSTTSGSGYQSFNPIETDSVYTPNFGSPGTYYVICEADFAGTPENSNEVIIIVAAEGTGIDELGIKFNIFNTGDYLQVDYEGNTSSAILNVYTLDGKSVYKSSVQKGSSQHNIEASPGIYIYRLVEGDKIVTGKIRL